MNGWLWLAVASGVWVLLIVGVLWWLSRAAKAGQEWDRAYRDAMDVDRCVVTPNGSVLHKFACDFGEDCPSPGRSLP